MSALPHHFVQWFSRGSWTETSLLDSRDGRAVKKAVSDAPYVRVPGHRALRFKSFLAIVLRQCSKPIYLGPLLIPFVVLSSAPYDGYLLILYVLSMVGFFTALALFILWSIVCFGVTRNLAPDVALPTLEDLEIEEPSAEGARVRIRGKVVPLTPMEPGSPVLVDAWCLSASPPWRSTRAADFAVIAFGEEPVIVRVESAPLVVADPEPGDFPTHLKGLGEIDHRLLSYGPHVDLAEVRGGELLTLRAGDSVEVIAELERSIPNVARFELGGVSRQLPRDEGRMEAPYRRGPQGSGRLVVSRRSQAVRVRLLASPRSSSSRGPS